MTDLPQDNSARNLPKSGSVFVIPYPFMRCTVEVCGEEGPERINSWRPGVEFEMEGGHGDYEGYANAVGQMRLTVIDVFKPGRFPTRVFYTRKFISPEGHEFGKGGLRFATVEKFRRIAKGYAWSYDVEDNPPVPAPPPAAPAWSEPSIAERPF